MFAIGIDNGVTGSIGWIFNGKCGLMKMPVRRVLNYGQSGKYINRIDVHSLKTFLVGCKMEAERDEQDIKILMERPFTGGPTMIQAMLSAARSFEATLIVVETVKIGFRVIDSREWQKVLLPKVKGTTDLKKASQQKAREMWPDLKTNFTISDADGLMIAEYLRRSQSV
jgi:hypothetical protein